jgi:hypothetical protein
MIYATHTDLTPSQGDPIKCEDEESNLAMTILVAGANQWHNLGAC